MFVAVGLDADRRHLGAELLERLGRDRRVRAVRAVDADPEAGEVAAEALDDVLEVAVRRDVDAVDLAAAGALGVEQRLDLLLGGVGQLAALRVEELDAVVLGRVVRGGDHDAEVEREQRDRRRRQHAREHGHARRRATTPRANASSSSTPEAARVAADEDAAAAGPERGRAAEPLDELRGEVLSDDAPDAVGAEVAASHARCAALRELRRLAGLVETGLLALDDARVAREEALALERDPQLRVGLDERAGDAVPHGSGLAARAAAVDANADVVRPLRAGDAQRRGREVAMRDAREVLLDRAAVEPGLAVTGAQDHARNGGLPLAGAEILGDLCHAGQSSNGSGLGACASCGCTGPA